MYKNENTKSTIPQMLKITEIAEMYNLPVHFVRALVNNGEVVATRVGKKILVNAGKFWEYLESNTLSSENSANAMQNVEEKTFSNPRLRPISLKRG